MMAFLPAGAENDSDEDWDNYDDSEYSTVNWDKNSLQKNLTNNNIGNTKAQSENRVSTSAYKQRNGSFHQSHSWAPDLNSWPRNNSFLTSVDFQRAAANGNLEIIQLCLDQGIPIDEEFRQGWTALMFAANNANVEAVRLLLKRGADPRYSIDMFSPLMACCNASSKSGESIATCVKLLVEAGASVNSKDRYHTTCLMLASREGHVQAVNQLIQLGASVNSQDSKGWTALTWATQRQQKAVVVALLDGGADCNIQHLDKLTVKDLAAHLPTDEMLALLERRPANVVNSFGVTVVDTRKKQESADENHSILELGDSQAKLTDLRYGELEVFLIGLDLPHLVDVCHKQLIDLNLLLTLTEADLINAGISQVGARKKILDAAQTVHKKDWEPSSLVSIHYNRKIMCADAVAMVANSSKHLGYIQSSMIYLRGHLVKHPNSLLLPTERVSPVQLLRYTEDALKNTQKVQNELNLINKKLKEEINKRDCSPPDVMRKKSIFLWGSSFFGVVVLTSVVSIVIVKRQIIIQSLSQMGHISNS